MPQCPVPLLITASASLLRSSPVVTFARSLRRMALVLAGTWAVLQGPVWAQPPSTPENSEASRSVRLSLRQLTGNRLTLRGANSEHRVHLGVRLDEMVVRARLNLAVTPSPALLPTLSHLQVRLNDRLLNVPWHPDERHQLVISTSIGIAYAPLHGRSSKTLLQLADRAMYHAKNSRKGSVHEFIHQHPQVPLRFDSGFDALPSAD